VNLNNVSLFTFTGFQVPATDGVYKMKRKETDQQKKQADTVSENTRKSLLSGIIR